MKIVNPFRNIKQYTKISIEPYHMNSDIRNHMKIVLKKKVEKKCNRNGYIDEVYRIIDYSDGVLISENLNGSAIYDITYLCRICIPIENTIIIGYVKLITSDLIICVNGPITMFISKENIDGTFWDASDNYLNKNNKERLKVSSFVKIQILTKRINQNDTQIKAIGKLLDYATDDEINKYYDVDGKKVNKEKTEETTETTQDNSNFII